MSGRAPVSSSRGVTSISFPFGGNGSISGTHSSLGVLRRQGTPGVVRYVVTEMITGRAVGGGVSNSTGGWTVSNLNPDYAFSVRITDRTGTLNGAIVDWVYPE